MAIKEINVMTNFDFSALGKNRRRQKSIDPIDIFRTSRVTDKNVNDLWLGQGDALREWHKSRHLDDIGVVLNTGAGKTLVGLLIAQSLVNETEQQVVYSCGSIQLVQQTAEKASGYGIQVATYHSGKFENEQAYFSATAPCLTTYHALFNGKTRFRKDDVSAVIFDDAHTADNILRDQFSLRISRELLPDTYNELVALFDEYHRKIGRASSYHEVANGKSKRIFMIPPFEVHRNAHEIRRILAQAPLGENVQTLFAWEHIIDHEDLCCWLVSSHEVTVTPAIVPVATLPYFRKGTRRVYLSATLSASDAFARSFGRIPQRIVAPPTPAGKCERMILIPSMLCDTATNEDVTTAMDVISNHKAFILVPSYSRAELWKDVVLPPPTLEVTEHLNEFRKSDSPAKLLLTARFDGIDLPGDTCRVMVIDDLPAGSGPLERFQRDSLNMDNSIRSTIASRIVQSFGRISRGMTDHGVVILTGEELINWIRIPRNRTLLPGFLQHQLELGEEISDIAGTLDKLIAVIEACLNRQPEWIAKYSDHMRTSSSPDSGAESKIATEVALAEASFGELLWSRNFHKAAKVLEEIQNRAVEFSQYTGAWLTMWWGYAVELAGHVESAHNLYRRAYTLNSNIPRLPMTQQAVAEPVRGQLVKVAGQMQVSSSQGMSVNVPQRLYQDLLYLNGLGSVTQTEEALRCLGQYLGLESTRPDKEHGTGPDVLWIGEGGFAVIMEVKTNKKESSSYKKSELGQLRDHVQWVLDHHQTTGFGQVVVGPLLPSSKQANPSPEMMVIELKEFQRISKRLVSTIQDVAENALPLKLIEELNEKMKARGLVWPNVYKAIRKSKLLELTTDNGGENRRKN